MLVGLLAFAAALALGAAPASAFIVRLPNGKEISYEAKSGSKTPQPPRIFDARFSNLDYSGGPVMPANTNYTIVWNPSNYGGTPFQAGYVSGVDQFFTDVGHDSGQATNSYSVASQYNDGAGNTAAYNSHYGGSFSDTSALPANGCSVATICLTDAQLQAELDSVLSSNGLPRDLSHEYFLLTPPDVVTCLDAAGTQCSGSEFCAYHSASTTPSSFIYTDVPDVAGVDGCDPFVTHCPDLSCSYNNGPADGVLSAVSHEQIESNTDPQPNNAWTDWQQCGQSALPTCGGEIGDKCNNDAFNDPNIQYQNDGSGNDTPYNETINGNHYLIQQEWSNHTKQCLDSLAPTGALATASFTPSSASGNTITFDASPSTAPGGVAEYVWQFNDGPGAQTTTMESTNPSITHTFAASGFHDVALTVMAIDGTSSATASNVLAGGSAPAPAFSATSGLEGVPTSFDGRGSSDPNPRGLVNRYSWDFGDGGTASGATASHTFAAGSYTVTLTVTDNYGYRNAVSRALTIADESPSASFGGSGGLAGGLGAFSGSGLDPDGSIVSYSWTFGDGASGSGVNPAHRYARPGVYMVTLNVTDSNGRSASASHRITALPSCLVPNVKGKSQAVAQRRLGAAGCKLGKVTAPRKHKPHAKLVVSKESPRVGSLQPANTKIKLTLVYK